MVSLIVAVALHQGSISLDPRLARPMDFDASLVPLTQLVQNVSIMSGVSMTVDPSLDHLKVDAFLEDQPMGVTLAKLSEAFDLEWQVDGHGYKLVQSSRNTIDTNNYIHDEDQLVTDVVNKQIAVYRLIDELVPKSDKPWPKDDTRFKSWKPSRDQASIELEAAKTSGVTKEKLEKLEIRFDALDKISEGTPNLQLARLFGRMTPYDIGEYRSGIPYIASNTPRSRFSFSRGDIKPNDTVIGNAEPKSVIFTRLDPGSKRIGFKESTYYDNIFAVAAEPASHYPFDEVTPKLAKKPFATRLLEWDESKKLSKVLTGTLVKDESAVEGWPSVWYSKRFRLGDHLRWFHQVSGVPVIAPANRTIHPFIKLRRAASSQGEYLASLLKACNGFAHKSDDFLLVRDGVYWRKALNEIPEDDFATLEGKRAGKLSLKSFEKFASKISRMQAMLVQDPKGFVVNFPRYSFGEVYPVLQFVDSLDASQIEQAQEEWGLKYVSLTPTQKELFQYAFMEGITDRAFISESLLDNLTVGGVNLKTTNVMTFYIRSLVVSATYAEETGIDGAEPILLVPKRVQRNRPTINFELGYDSLKWLTFSTEAKNPF